MIAAIRAFGALGLFGAIEQAASSNGYGVIVTLISGAAIVGAAIVPSVIKTRRESKAATVTATEAKVDATQAKNAAETTLGVVVERGSRVDRIELELRDIGARYTEQRLMLEDVRHELKACEQEREVDRATIASLAREHAEMRKQIDALHG